MSNSVLPTLDSSQLQQLVATLTQPRLSKYLRASRNNDHQALRLYVLNTKVSAAFLADLHYVEIALRNKFDGELCAGFGPEWFKDQTFLPCTGRSAQPGNPAQGSERCGEALAERAPSSAWESDC